MTVTQMKPAPDPVAHARDVLAEATAYRTHNAEGISVGQVVADLEDSVRELLALVGATETVTEYGVRSWSKAFGRHHVDECRDLPEARSVLANTRQKIDVLAHLVSRSVPVSTAPPTEWRLVSPDEAIESLEATR